MRWGLLLWLAPSLVWAECLVVPAPTVPPKMRQSVFYALLVNAGHDVVPEQETITNPAAPVCVSGVSTSQLRTILAATPVVNRYAQDETARQIERTLIFQAEAVVQDALNNLPNAQLDFDQVWSRLLPDQQRKVGHENVRELLRNERSERGLE